VINTKHDKIVDIANDKYWEISQRYNTTTTSSSSSTSSSSVDVKQLCECLSVQSYYTKIESDTYAVFKLGPIEVRSGRVTATAVGFLSYCLYVLVMVKAKV
jgi:hypothetical protein